MSVTNETKISSTNIQEHKQLWDDLMIFFRLDSNTFAGNKIIGSLTFLPEEAFDLIDTFVLVTNKSLRTKFDRKFRKISASGFDPNEKKLSVRIEAISNKPYLEPRSSEEQYFNLVYRNTPLLPTVQFCWPDPDSKESKPDLIVRWFHIGDQLAQVYIICLDGKEIYYVRDAPKHDIFQVRIQRFQPGSTHQMMIIARSDDGEETCRSEEITVTAPVDKLKQFSEIINVTEEPGSVDDMQDLIKKYQEKPRIQPVPAPPIKKPDLPRSSRIYKQSRSTFSCGCGHLHTTFPGIDHYFNNNNDQQTENHSSTKEDNDDDDDDDDDDVVM